MATAPASPKAQVVSVPDALWEEAGWLPCQLTVETPVRGFTIGDLLRLQVNAVVITTVPSGGDMPLRINGAPIGMAAFEVVDEHLAVRLTQID